MKDRFLPYEEAKAFVYTLNLMNFKEWNAYSKSGKRPWNIPASPNVIYKNKGWVSWYVWLGTSVKTYLSYDEAKAFIHTLKLKSFKDWEKYNKICKRPCIIPSHPHEFYKNKGWVNWYDWIGTQKKSKKEIS